MAFPTFIEALVESHQDDLADLLDHTLFQEFKANEGQAEDITDDTASAPREKSTEEQVHDISRLF